MKTTPDYLKPFIDSPPPRWKKTLDWERRLLRPPIALELTKQWHELRKPHWTVELESCPWWSVEDIREGIHEVEELFTKSEHARALGQTFQVGKVRSTFRALLVMLGRPGIDLLQASPVLLYAIAADMAPKRPRRGLPRGYPLDLVNALRWGVAEGLPLKLLHKVAGIPWPYRKAPLPAASRLLRGAAGLDPHTVMNHAPMEDGKALRFWLSIVEQARILERRYRREWDRASALHTTPPPTNPEGFAN